MSNPTIATPLVGNTDDVEYDAYLARVQSRFLATPTVVPLFTVGADGLWGAYLEAMPSTLRQYHTCSACRGFIEHYGNLVTIADDGSTASAVWNLEDTPPEYVASVRAMLHLLRRARVTGVFYTSEPTWGHPVTGAWRHFAVVPPTERLYRRGVLTAGQRMAEQREDYNTVSRALAEWTEPVIAQALGLLRADTLYRSEKVLGQAEWLYALHTSRSALHGERKANLVWRAIAAAPTGFCHPRASMIGTLLDDIAAGLDFGEVSRKFKEKMHPLQYQRPTAAPAAGAIIAAERLVETLGIARSLERRFARLEEVEALWKPAPPTAQEAAGNGVFAHLTPKGATPAPDLKAPTVTMTWEKFRRIVLPEARVIEILVPSRGNFTALLTAEHFDAPPILQWDRDVQRNPVSTYVYHHGSPAAQWGLAPGYAAVTAITLSPSEWGGGVYPHQPKGLTFLVAGAVDSRDDAGNALFPETLRNELHGARAVIEAYSRKAVIGGREQAGACGLVFSKKEVVTVRVASALGPRLIYKIDRLD